MLKQLLHLRTLLIALLVMAGAGNVWGQTTVTQTTFSSTSGNVNNDTNVSYTSYKGGGTSNPEANSDAIRLYQNSGGATGGYVVIGVSEGYVITSATIRSTMATTTGYLLTDSSPSSTPLKNTFNVSNKVLTANTDYTVSDISSRYITFACFGTSKTSRLYLSKISITYQAENSSAVQTTTTIDASGITNTDVYKGTEAGLLSASVTAGGSSVEGASVTWTSATPSVATIDSSTGVVTLVAPGTTMITASYKGKDNYASSSDEYELTVTSSAPYVQPTEISFPLNNTGFGTSYNGSVSDITDDNPITNTINNLTVTYAGSGYHYLNDTQIRLYPNNKLTFEAPSGYEITKIVLIPVSNGTWTATISSNPGSYDTSIKTWTGSASLVEFSGGSGSGVRCDIASATITLAVQKALRLSPSSVNTPYGTDATVDATVLDGYDDGKLAAESSNTSIATASVEGTTITIRPEAVGTTTITVTAPATSTFSEPATGTITVTVTAPEGKTKAAAITVFEETFADCDGTGGNDGSWNGSIASNTLRADNEGWNFTQGGGADNCAKFGSGSKKGSATTPALGESGTLTLSFRAAAWNSSNEGTTLKLSVSAGTINESSVTLTKGEFKTYTATITNATKETKITFEAANTSDNRFFLDDVVVTKPGVALTATLNGSGYATYCSEYPLDFSAAKDYRAWQVTAVDGEAITFVKVTGSVKGGTGLLLMGEHDATVTLTSEDSETVLETNKLIGTLAPTYVEDNKYYGLSGQQFLKVNHGTVPAGKALLPASVVENAGNVRTLSLVFVDPTTGIAETKTMTNEDAIYNLAGQRIGKAQRGVNIVGGKKVLVK